MLMLLKQLARDERGVAYIEGSIAIILMFIIFFGMMEITTYISVRERMEKASGQLAQVLGSIPKWDAGEVTRVMDSAKIIAEPQGISVAAVFCENGSAKYAFSSSFGGAGCGLSGSKSGAGGAAASASCADGAAAGSGQYVVIATQCAYTPFMNPLGLFNDGFKPGGTSSFPMKTYLPW
jgi:hypothetical protein